MTSRRADVVDVALLAGSLGAFLVAAAVLDILAPTGIFEWLLVGVVSLAHVGAAALLLAPGDRRAVSALCLAMWLLVLFALPAYFIGLYFAPSALLLTLALYRPRSMSPAVGEADTS